MTESGHQWSGGQSRVVVDDETGREVINLTNSNYHDVHTYYDISPWADDGRRIVFSRADPATLQTMSIPTQVSDREYKGFGGNRYTDEGAIFTMTEDGSNERCLVDGVQFTTHSGCFPSWIPGQERIVYGQWKRLAGEDRLVVYDLNRDDRVVVRDLFPRQVSPDGDKIACRSSRGVVILDLDTFDQRVILTLEEVIDATGHDASDLYDPEIANLKWSPDGSKMILRFSDSRDGSHVKELCLFNADGSDIRTVSAASERFHHHLWHPDSERILFGDRDDEGKRLYFTDIHNLGEKELISDEPLGHHPSVSPDGSKIVTDTYVDTFGGGILLVDVESGAVEKLTSFAMTWRRLTRPPASSFGYTGFHAHPVWKDDGSGILYNSDQAGTCDLYFIPLEEA